VTQTLVELKNIDLALGEGASRVHILKDISLKLRRNEKVGIVGPSGSGKSTLLMVLAGLEKIDKGSVHIDGTHISSLSEDKAAEFRGRTVGIVFQSFHLIPNMTALENTAVPLELSGHRNAFDIASQMLESVGLSDRLHHYPATLSGGEQQRVAIARALAPRPKIIIADEPTGNLDSITGAAIADLMFARASEQDATMVLVTHDGDLARRCDRQIHLRNGCIERLEE